MYELLFSSQQPKAKDFRRHYYNVLFALVRQQLSDKLHAMETEDLTNRVQALEFTNEIKREAHQQQILRLNEEHQQSLENKEQEINNQAQGTWPAVYLLTTCYVLSKRTAKVLTHITFFDVSKGSWKNISNGLNFINQRWRWLTNVMIQMLFIDGTGSSMK